MVLTAGRLWDYAKNIGLLREIAPRLEWPIYVAGEQQQPEGGMVSTGELRPLGRLSTVQLAHWYGRAAIYALPARYEPFGLSILEAALSGCALVLGDIDSLHEVWGDAALYVDINAADGLHAALQRLIQEPDLLTQMAARAQCRARRYTPQKMARSYLAAYRSLLEKRALQQAAATDALEVAD